jgi:ferredoxin
VCALEQNWAATQTIPGPVGEQTALSTNAELIELTVQLALWLQDRGYEARAHTTEGAAIIQHYAVQAGLGQLGYNGQLLTPQAGSRCRLTMVSTNAPLPLDAPRDFGIPAICASCRACVRRCPSGAIPARPAMYRGVEKTKLRLDRCFPVVSQVNGCSVCMKVCPVQRYGLARVLDHFERNDGEVLGVGTDELEGYVWPLDGRHYGPGARPTLDPAFFDVPGFGSQRVDPSEHVVTANPLM